MSTSTRGFASMTKEQRSAFGRIGALAAHKSGRAYRWNSKSAGEAGMLGGIVSGAIRRELTPEQRKLKRPRRRKRKPVPVAPVPVVPPTPTPDPKTQLAEHLRKVARDALVRSGDPGTADKKRA